jgi:hypothetical protein
MQEKFFSPGMDIGVGVNPLTAECRNDAADALPPATLTR